MVLIRVLAEECFLAGGTCFLKGSFGGSGTSCGFGSEDLVVENLLGYWGQRRDAAFHVIETLVDRTLVMHSESHIFPTYLLPVFAHMIPLSIAAAKSNETGVAGIWQRSRWYIWIDGSHVF